MLAHRRVSKGETIDFVYRGQAYSIDLTDKEAAGFDKSIAMYIEHGAKASDAGRSPRRKTSMSNGSSKSRDELANIRAWARDNDHPVSDRVRIPQKVVDAYHNAQA